MFTDKSGTKWEILSVLRENGESSVKALETETEVSSSTLNEHLSDLRAMELIDKHSKRDGPGRPQHLYFLTDEAEELFPHAYSKLASMLLEVVNSLIDEPQTRRKLTDVLTEHFQEYDDLESALKAFGFFPEFSEQGKRTTIKYHQCPFYEVAQEAPSLCDVDREVLEEMTGKSVSKNSCIVSGSESCEFVLTEN